MSTKNFFNKKLFTDFYQFRTTAANEVIYEKINKFNDKLHKNL
jgi:hypothetical protein